MKSDVTKDNILQETIRLLQESDGLPETITIRRIAERAGVGVGLINHYFGSKDNLMEICVQTIISGVIGAFRPALGDCTEPLGVTKSVAKQVMDFLMANPQISRASILGDMRQPKTTDNTMKTVFGLGSRLSEGQLTVEHKRRAFLITAALQEAFLRRDLMKESFDVDFYDKKQRDQFIDDIVERYA